VSQISYQCSRVIPIVQVYKTVTNPVNVMWRDDTNGWAPFIFPNIIFEGAWGSHYVRSQITMYTLKFSILEIPSETLGNVKFVRVFKFMKMSTSWGTFMYSKEFSVLSCPNSALQLCNRI